MYNLIKIYGSKKRTLNSMAEEQEGVISFLNSAEQPKVEKNEMNIYKHMESILQGFKKQKRLYSPSELIQNSGLRNPSDLNKKVGRNGLVNNVRKKTIDLYDIKEKPWNQDDLDYALKKTGFNHKHIPFEKIKNKKIPNYNIKNLKTKATLEQVNACVEELEKENEKKWKKRLLYLRYVSKLLSAKRSISSVTQSIHENIYYKDEKFNSMPASVAKKIRFGRDALYRLLWQYKIVYNNTLDRLFGVVYNRDLVFHHYDTCMDQIQEKEADRNAKVPPAVSTEKNLVSYGSSCFYTKLTMIYRFSNETYILYGSIISLGVYIQITLFVIYYVFNLVATYIVAYNLFSCLNNIFFYILKL